MEILKTAARFVAASVSFGMLVLFILPMFSNIINIGNISGALLCLWGLCVSIEPLNSLIRSAADAFAVTKVLRVGINVCFIAFAVYGALVSTAMAVAAAQKPAPGSTAVVLGAQVKPWGPSVMLQARIDAAEKYLLENPEAAAVLSGGKGDDEVTSEAECMFTVMKNDGIEYGRLYLEERSATTDENLKFSRAVIDANSLNADIAIVTDGFHQLRARIIAAKLGIKENVGAVCADTSLLYLPTFAVREWFALPNQLLFR